MVEFIVKNGNARKHFSSIEEFRIWAKKKLPVSGDTWELEEVITETKTHFIECERKRINDTGYIRKVIDEFIEKANEKNIKFTHTEFKMTDSRYNNFTRFQSSVYYMAEKLGYPWEKLDALYANKDDILVGRLDMPCGNKFTGDYNNFDDIEYSVGELAPLFIIQDRFNIKNEDITVYNYNYGSPDRNYIVDGKWTKIKNDPSTLAIKYPEAVNYLNEFDNMAIYNDNICVELSPEEAVEEYKKRISEYPVDNIKVTYNTGNYKPCNNYKFDFLKEYDPRGKDYYKTENVFSRIPGIMFRDEDIIITTDNYYGRNVKLRNSSQCDVDENLYNYCIKNLNK